jgi:hypothetical protein
LSYHRSPARWVDDNNLQVVGRGQEFVADVGDLSEPKEWLAAVLDAIES